MKTKTELDFMAASKRANAQQKKQRRKERSARRGGLIAKEVNGATVNIPTRNYLPKSEQC